MSRATLSDLSPALQAQVIAQEPHAKTKLWNELVAQEPARKRIRQRQGDGMNNWERAFRAHIAPFFEHVHREVSLPLANGLRYKLDFLCVDKFGVVIGYEVKGRALPTGIAKVKMAATLYPWIKFKLATKTRTGWDTEEVYA